MPKYRTLSLFFLCATLCHAQATRSDQALLSEVRAKYDAPFSANLQSFDCAIDFNWKQHFTEVVRLGDEGTDEQIATLIQPLHTRVNVTRDKVTPSSGLTPEDERRLPFGGMAEGLLKHAVQKSLSTWLSAANNAFLPQPGTPVSFQPVSTGYKLAYKIESFDVEMSLTPDMRILRATPKQDPNNALDLSFQPGPHGFELASMTINEDSNPQPGNRLIFSFTYQTIDGITLPEHVALIRESHHEAWHFTLTGCAVKTSN